MPSYIRECHYGIAEVARVSSPIVRHLEVPGDFRAHYYYLPSKIAETYSRLYVFLTYHFFPLHVHPPSSRSTFPPFSPVVRPNHVALRSPISRWPVRSLLPSPAARPRRSSSNESRPVRLSNRYNKVPIKWPLKLFDDNEEENRRAPAAPGP